VCTETIYEAVYRGVIVPVDRQNLRTGRVYRHRRGRGRTRDGALKQSTTMKSIHQLPPSVASRRQAGHWEGDLLVGAGQRSAIATLVERKFRLTILVPVPRNHSAQSVGDALIGAFTKVPTRLRRTLTWDQGNEMFHHQRIEEHTGLNIYFADPHSPWQRGANEKHQRAATAILAEGDRPQRLDRRPTGKHRRRAERPTAPLPGRPDTTASHATMDPTANTTMIRNVH
jgi:transposase, IS30 family